MQSHLVYPFINMKKNIQFSLVIPLWNEEKNLLDLVKMLKESKLLNHGLKEAILVDNGSTDNTKKLLKNISSKRKWIIPVFLKKNLNYGGGIYEGFKYITSEYVAFIPGDLQIHANDLKKIWYILVRDPQKSKSLYKGYRIVRYDSFQMKLVSMIYTFLSNLILGLDVKDVNGLPKIFHKSLINKIPQTRMKTFVFDSQLISVARQNKYLINEIPVTFFSRREGLSSWSSKRIRIYILVLYQLIRLFFLKSHRGVPITFKR